MEELLRALEEAADREVRRFARLLLLMAATEVCACKTVEEAVDRLADLLKRVPVDLEGMTRRLGHKRPPKTDGKVIRLDDRRRNP